MTARTQSIAEACDKIHDASREQGRITVVGGGTKSNLDKPRTGERDVHLCTQSLNSVLEFSPADLTIVVEAGITLRELDRVLAPHDLRLPLDPPDYDGGATLGGVLATNDSGPMRLAHGTAREHVIGMSMILADGSLIKSGGKVVKNVAGYDLHRLFVGSFGSLGLIATVSLKLKPRAEAVELTFLQARTIQQADEWTAALLAGDTRPAILDWVRPAPAWAPRSAAADARSTTIIVGFEDTREAVDWQVQRLCSQFGASRCDNSIECYEDLRARRTGHGGASFRALIPVGRIASFFESTGTIPLHSHAACGVVHGALNSTTDASASDLQRLTASCGGTLIVRGADGTQRWHRTIDAATRELERRLKARLDPHGVFPAPPFM